MNLDVSVDKAELSHIMRGYENDINYTIQKTINDTLVNIQEDVRANMKEEFQIRRPQFLKQSTKVTKFAKKTDLEGEFAIVPVGSTKESLFAKFEDGGNKTAESGHSVAVPTSSIRPDTTKVIPAGKRPRALKNSAKITTGSGQEEIIQRKGRGKSATTIVAYVLKDSVRIRPLLHFYDTVRESIQKYLDANFAKAFEKAKSTAR